MNEQNDTKNNSGHTKITVFPQSPQPNANLQPCNVANLKIKFVRLKKAGLGTFQNHIRKNCSLTLCLLIVKNEVHITCTSQRIPKNLDGWCRKPKNLMILIFRAM